MPSVIGWDIGGVNTKAALVVDRDVRSVRTRPFELQRAPDQLAALLSEMAAALGATTPVTHAVTMTAELSQMFRTKREGVSFVLDAVERAFSDAQVRVYATDGSFVSPAAARSQPLLAAAANWVATAAIVASHHADALLVDVGTTTTDVIPIVRGRVAAIGRTDVARLASRELVYTGAIRTPVEAIVREVPVPGKLALVSAEGFALSGDVHVWLGDLAASDYDAATPDGRPPTREFAAERLVRVVCADREMLDEQAITILAQAIADEQVDQIRKAIAEVLARHMPLRTAVVTGLGAFIGARAARAAGLDVVPLASQLGEAGARSAPATAVALLLDEQLASLGGGSGGPGLPSPLLPARIPPAIAGAEHQTRRHLQGAAPIADARTSDERGLIVVKLGGGLVAHPDQWRAAIAAIGVAAPSRSIVVVPGGGPFADTVRNVDAGFGLSDESAHWMAIAGMDQHAEMIAAAGPAFVRVVDAGGIEDAHLRGQVPVLAPLQWLRRSDPLPHSWDVSSDSIAAWVAGALGARDLLLIKPAGAPKEGIVDPYFARALPPDLPWAACNAHDLARLLGAHEPSPR